MYLHFKLIFESILVAFYSILIYYFFVSFSFFNNNIVSFQTQLFVIGFAKHFFGWIFGLQKYYCFKTYKSSFSKNSTSLSLYPFRSIVLQSVGEGALFIFLGQLLQSFFKEKVWIIACIAALLHIVFDIMGVHKMFCKYYLINMFK